MAVHSHLQDDTMSVNGSVAKFGIVSSTLIAKAVLTGYTVLGRLASNGMHHDLCPSCNITPAAAYLVQEKHRLTLALVLCQGLDVLAVGLQQQQITAHQPSTANRLATETCADTTLFATNHESFRQAQSLC